MAELHYDLLGYAQCFSPVLKLTIHKGLVTACQGVTQSYSGLVVCRFLLGLFEAGFFPGPSE